MNHDKEILAGMARGVFVSEWANRQEERGRSFGGGVDLYEIAPRTPPKALKWAKENAALLVKANNLDSISDLFESAREHGYPKNPETFGYHVGMRLVGHGVSPQDDMPYKARKGWEYKSHHTEFYL